METVEEVIIEIDGFLKDYSTGNIDKEVIDVILNEYPHLKEAEAEMFYFLYQFSIRRKRVSLPITSTYIRYLYGELKKMEQEENT